MRALAFVLVGGLLSGCGSAPPPPATEVASATPAAAPPPSAPPAKYGAPLDASLIPAGKGWHCFGQSVALQCFREQAACDDRLAEVRARDAGGDPTVTTEGCLALEAAWCMTIRQSDGTKRLQCWTNETTCAEDGSFYRGQAERFDGEIPEGSPVATRASGCAALP